MSRPFVKKDKMKVVAISDTHGQHNGLELPAGDMLIHAGDMSKRGYSKEVKQFLRWFGAQDFKYKILIAGNHDFFFEKKPEAVIVAAIPENVIYLNDTNVVIEGIKIHGSPIQPWFYDWAFNRQRGEEIDKHWQLIPDDTDILITHGPAYGKLDTLHNGELVGCKMLAKRVEEVKPKKFIFGHIHEAHGELIENDVHYINASIVDIRYQLSNKPIVFEI